MFRVLDFQAVIFGSSESQFRDPAIFESPSNVLVQAEVSVESLKPDQKKLWKEAAVVVANQNFKLIPGMLSSSTKVLLLKNPKTLRYIRPNPSKPNQSIQSYVIYPLSLRWAVRTTLSPIFNVSDLPDSDLYYWFLPASKFSE